MHRLVVCSPLTALVLSGLFLVACGGKGPHDPSAGTDGGSDAGGVDAGPATSIASTATDGTLTLSYAAQIDGHGSSALSQISISGNVGTIEYQGRTVSAVAYEQIPFPAANNQTLYQVLAVDNERWIVAWAYCDSGLLNTIWFETTDGTPGTFENVSGTCVAASDMTDSHVQLPDFDLPFPALVPGFGIQGSDVQFDGQHPGTAAFASATWTFYPFGQVDCSMNCGTPGWWELHSILTDAATRRDCFGIFYLPDNVTHQVQLAYMLCLPTLDNPAGRATEFTADSSHP